MTDHDPTLRYHYHESRKLDALTDCVSRFIEAWEAKPHPNLSEFLPEQADLREAAWIELIKVDLEFRWLGDGDPLYLEDYLNDAPRDYGDRPPVELLHEEWHVRQQAGLQLNLTEYADRFPLLIPALARLVGDDEPTVSSAMVDTRCQSLLQRLKPGDAYDDFDLIDLLGRGAFGTVFLARQRSMHRLVALKISADRGEEAQTLAQFDHDYIVRVYDQKSRSDDQVRLLYMQYLAGGTLQDVVTAVRETPFADRRGALLFETVDLNLAKRGEVRSGRSPWRRELESSQWIDTVCWLGSCLAEGLDHAHRHEVLHRDIKPANVLLTAEGIPKLADFNISFCGRLEGATPAAYFGGSLAYMSPEQLEACNPNHPSTANEIEQRSDVYSLGIVLWELLYGERPFPNPDTEVAWNDLLQELARQRRDCLPGKPPVPPGTEPPHVPEVIQETLHRCLNPDREKRFANARELQQRLSLCVQPTIREFLFPEPWQWRSRLVPRLRWVMLALIFLPSLIAAVFNFIYNESEIVERLSETAQQHFLLVQTAINAVAFPLGLWISDLLIRKSLPWRQTDDGSSHRWRDTLTVGYRGAWLTLILWAVAGLAYPISMSLQSVATPLWVYAHFFLSLLMCGMFAVALTFFLLTSSAMLVIVPAAIRKGAKPEGLEVEVDRVQSRSWVALLISAAVPMLATIALVTIDSPNSRFFLSVISLGGMLGFALNLVLMSRLQQATQRLKTAFDNPTN